MTVTSGFFNSVAGDRTYDAEDFGRIFAGMIEDGIFKGIGTEFNVLATTGLSLTVGAGRAFFNEIWINNDDLEGVVASAAHSGLPRIDAVVIEVDKSDATRAASIKFKAGVAASNPTPPTMTHTATLDEYPLVHISRAAGSTSITNAHITKLVGTPACPYAVSRLLDRSFDTAVSHRKTFRGKNLGSSYTAAQRLAIHQGTFEDLYIGDYWVINGVTWRIVDIDYYYNQGNTPTLKHHVNIMPDTPLGFGAMNDDFYHGNASGYVGASVRSAGRLTPMHTKAVTAFGGNDGTMLYHDIVVTDRVSNGKPTGAQWRTVSLELPNLFMIFGANPLQPGADGSNLPPTQQTESTRQLALFDLAPWFIRTKHDPSIGGDPNVRSTTWLRDVLSPVAWGMIGMTGEATFGISTSQYFYRPIFSIIGQ